MGQLPEKLRHKETSVVFSVSVFDVKWKVVFLDTKFKLQILHRMYDLFFIKIFHSSYISKCGDKSIVVWDY